MIPLLNKSKWPLRTALYGAALSLLLSTYYIFQTHSYAVFPSAIKNSSYGFAYDDREQGGNSSAVYSEENGVIHSRFQLGSKYIYPYAGVSFPLGPPSAFSLAEFNTLRISLNVPKESNVLIILSQHIKQAGSGLNIVQQCEYLLSCSPGKIDYAIPFSSFKVPLWWIKSKQKAEPVTIDWSTINSLSFQNDPVLSDGFDQTISVKAIQFSKIYSWPIYAILIFLVLACILEYRVHRKDNGISIRYVPVSDQDLASAEPWDVLANYLAEHYREDISLETVFRDVGIAKHRISSLIKENTSLNFRQYINKIRIQEAERLLNNTSLSITEIGYEVGYTSATQFNRVFRDINGIAPSEYKREPAH